MPALVAYEAQVAEEAARAAAEEEEEAELAGLEEEESLPRTWRVSEGSVGTCKRVETAKDGGQRLKPLKSVRGGHT